MGAGQPIHRAWADRTGGTGTGYGRSSQQCLAAAHRQLPKLQWRANARKNRGAAGQYHSQYLRQFGDDGDHDLDGRCRLAPCDARTSRLWRTGGFPGFEIYHRHGRISHAVAGLRGGHDGEGFGRHHRKNGVHQPGGGTDPESNEPHWFARSAELRARSRHVHRPRHPGLGPANERGGGQCGLSSRPPTWPCRFSPGHASTCSPAPSANAGFLFPAARHCPKPAHQAPTHDPCAKLA